MPGYCNSIPDLPTLDLNITIDFILLGPKLLKRDTVFLVDRHHLSLVRTYLICSGGFSSLDPTYPRYNQGESQNDPLLNMRAYKAARLHNWVSSSSSLDNLIGSF